MIVKRKRQSMCGDLCMCVCVWVLVCVHVCWVCVVCVIFILSVTKCCVQRSHNFIIIFGRKKLVHDESLMCLFYSS